MSISCQTTKKYDVIIGYRADDSYFSYASDFVENTLSLEDLKTAMKLGKLGEQVVLMSKKAFDLLTFVESIVTIQRIVFNDDFWTNQQETIEICFKNDKEKTFLTHFLKNYPISIPRNAVYGLFAE